MIRCDERQPHERHSNRVLLACWEALSKWYPPVRRQTMKHQRGHDFKNNIIDHLYSLNINSANLVMILKDEVSIKTGKINV